MTYTYKASGDDANGYTLIASPSGFGLPEVLHPSEGILHLTRASAFASAQEHARSHNQTILPTDLSIVADEDEDDEDVEYDDLADEMAAVAAMRLRSQEST